MTKLRMRAIQFLLLCVLGFVTYAWAQNQSVTLQYGLQIGGAPLGLLTHSAINNRYFVNPNGQVVYLTGSQTWDMLQDTSTAAAPAAVNFSTFVAMLQATGQNFTVLWYRDMPRECSWQNSQNYNLSPQPWPRTGPGNASDGLLKFNLSQFNQAFFDRLTSRIQTLQAANIYVGILLFDTNDLTFTRCGTNTSPSGDGFPLTGTNNVNGIDDGYTGSGATAGVGSVTESGPLTNPNLVAIQDAYVKKVVDSVNGFSNVIYEVSEEQPGPSYSTTPGWGGASSIIWWAPHIRELLATYEGGGTCTSCTGTPTFSAKPQKHLIGIGSMNANDPNDPVLYSSAFDWIAPTVSSNFNNQFPCIPQVNNQGKLVILDSDHACDASTLVVAATGAINDVQIRNSLWGCFTSGCSGWWFMDPNHMYLPVNNRNPCAGQTFFVCTGPMTKYDPMRLAMGYVNLMVPRIKNLLAMTPQASLASSGLALANNSATTSEFVVYSPAAVNFTVNLSAQNGRLINSEWMDPTTGIVTAGTSVQGGSATQSYTAPWGNNHDAVLHLTDGGGSFALGWTPIPNSTPQTVCPSTSTFTGINGSEGCAAVMNDWSGGWGDTNRNWLCFWGGGHAGYYGNEIYCMDPVNVPHIFRLTDPANNPNSQCSNSVTMVQNLVWQNNTPNITHNYQGNVYLPTADKVLSAMGDLSRGTNNCTATPVNDTLARFWGSNLFNVGGLNFAALPNAAGGWKQLDPFSNGGLAAGPTGSISFNSHPNCGQGSGGCTHLGWGRDAVPLGEYASSAWWQQQQRALVYDQFTMYAYEPALNVATELAGSGVLNTSSFPSVVGDYDPDHQLYWMIGGGQSLRFHTDTFVSENVSTTGCAALFNTPGPGLSYDNDMGLFTGWAGGQTVYLFNGSDASVVTANYGTVAAKTCVTIAPPLNGGTPPTPPAAGTNGRYRFFSGVKGNGIYELCPQMNSNCFVLSLNPSIVSGHKTFAQRAAGPGVVFSQAISSAAEVTTGHISPGDNGGGAQFDPNNKPPNDGVVGSMDMFTDAVTGSQALSGEWITAQWAATFGPPTHPGLFPTMFVQYRYMDDTNMATTDWGCPAGCQGLKLAIIHGIKSCGSEELTNQNLFGRGFLQMYTNCGSTGFATDLGNGDLLYEQSTPIDGTANTNWKYNCHRNFNSPNECMMVENVSHPYANNWVTVTLKLVMTGEWGVTNNAHINAWASYDKGTLQPDGQISDGTMRQFINFTTTLDCDVTSPDCHQSGSNEGFRFLSLLLYETGGSPAHPVSHRRYCCAIASKNAIPAPDGPTPQ